MSAEHAEHLLEYMQRILGMTPDERVAEDRRHDANGYAAAREAIRGRAMGDFGAPPVAASLPGVDDAPTTPTPSDVSPEYSPDASPMPTADAPPAPADDPKESVGDFARYVPLVAYTDGSGTVASKTSGAGVVVYDGDDVVLEASRHLGNGTNNHAEVSAVRIALAITDTPDWRARPLVIRSDSEYAIHVVSTPREPREGAANERLILATRKLLVGRRVTFEHVDGHSGVEGNERADHLANLGRKRTPKAADRSAA